MLNRQLFLGLHSSCVLDEKASLFAKGLHTTLLAPLRLAGVVRLRLRLWLLRWCEGNR